MGVAKQSLCGQTQYLEEVKSAADILYYQLLESTKMFVSVRPFFNMCFRLDLFMLSVCFYDYFLLSFIIVVHCSPSHFTLLVTFCPKFSTLYSLSPFLCVFFF